MKKGTSLIIFTNMFPYDNVETFLEEEIETHINYFDEVILVPNQLGPLHRSLPKKVKVENSFATSVEHPFLKKMFKRVFTAIRSAETYKEITKNPTILLKPPYLRTLLYFISQTEFYCLWLNKYLQLHPHLKNGIFYSYWLHVQSHGIALYKKRNFPDLHLISRAHAYEIYLDDYFPPYLPCRETYLPFIDKIFTISNHGKEKLLERDPTLIGKISTSRLGVPDPQFLNPHNSDETLSIASTSFLIPLKRVHLIINTIYALVEKNHYKKITWNHFGDGPLKEELTILAEKTLGDTVEWTFHGHVDRKTLFSFYQKTPIDLFLNTSETEGIPLSIMEALSCGIPILATDVGAVSEIVNSSVGILLESNPSPEKIAEAILMITKDKGKMSDLRRDARKQWETLFSAENNFKKFAEEISQVK